MNDAPRTFSFEIRLPPKCLSPNARPHWAQRSKAAKSYKLTAKQIASAACPGRPMRSACRFQAAFTFTKAAGKNGLRDPDNLQASLKYLVDGLVLAGVLSNDDKVTYLPVTQRIDKSLLVGFVTVTIELEDG